MLALQLGDKAGVQAAVQSTRKRALAWLNKDAEGQWRPKKRHRVSASEWIMEVDAQLRAGAGVGLSHYAPPAEGVARPPDATTWPLLQVTFDGGSDGHCAMHWLQRLHQCNIDEAPDIAHGLHRDMELTILRCGLSLHQKLMRICWNVHLGPWNQHERFQQVVDCLEEAWATIAWRSMVIDILFDLDLQHRATEEGIEEVVWEMMQQDSPFAKKGRMTDANRFIATVREGHRQHKNFNLKKYAYLRLSLEMDFLRGEKLKRLRLGGANNDAGEGEEKGRTGRTSAEELALRGACANSMAVATMILADPENQHRQGCLSTMMTQWDKWHSHQSKSLRSTGGALEWCLRQVQGDFLSTCAGTWAMLQSERDLRRCGLSFSASLVASSAGDESAFHGHTASQSDLSNLVGNLCLHMCGMRLRRMLWLLAGWPASSVAFLGPNGDEAMERLRRDESNFQWLASLGSSAARRLYDRHIFHLTCNKQLLRILETANWDLNEIVLDWIRRRSRRLVATQAVEDGFNAQRRQETTASNKTMRNATYFWALVSKKVLGVKHHFDEVQKEEASMTTGAILPPSAYQSSPSNCSLPAHKIIGTSSAVPWYTAGAYHHGVVFGDLAFIEFCRQFDLGAHMGEAEIFCCLLRVERMIVRRVGAPSCVSDAIGACYVFGACQNEQ